MTLLQTLNKDVRSSIERVLYILDPVKHIRLKVSDARDDQHFLNVSRELWKLTARSIVLQVRDREKRKGKMTPERMQQFAIEKAEASGLVDPLVSSTVAEMTMKLYILGDAVPDNQL